MISIKVAFSCSHYRFCCEKKICELLANSLFEHENPASISYTLSRVNWLVVAMLTMKKDSLESTFFLIFRFDFNFDLTYCSS